MTRPVLPASIAYFRVEGVLTRRPTWAAPAWLAANAQTWSQRAFGVSTTALSAAWNLPIPSLQDRSGALRLAWAGLRDVSEDRVVLLGETWYEAWMKDAVPESARTLLDRARRQGNRIVLISEGIRQIVGHLARDLGADDLICNELEWRSGRATGRLLDPLVGPSPVDRVREHAMQAGVPLSECSAYASYEADGIILGAVGRPCAVQPDEGLRKLCRDLGWPLVVDGGR